MQVNGYRRRGPFESKSIENLVRYSLHLAAIGIDNKICYLTVKRVALLHEGRQDFLAIAVFEQRTLAPALRALQLLLYRGVEVNDEAARTKVAAVLRVDYGAAAGGQDDAFLPGQVVDGLGFSLAKALLAFLFEDKRDIHSRARLDFVVAVLEFQVQQAAQLPADSGLARTHRAYQEYILRLFHRVVLFMRKPTRGLAFIIHLLAKAQ